jgi:hypothetical protein
MQNKNRAALAALQQARPGNGRSHHSIFYVDPKDARLQAQETRIKAQDAQLKAQETQLQAQETEIEAMRATIARQEAEIKEMHQMVNGLLVSAAATAAADAAALSAAVDPLGCADVCCKCALAAVVFNLLHTLTPCLCLTRSTLVLTHTDCCPCCLPACRCAALPLPPSLHPTGHPGHPGVRPQRPHHSGQRH